MQTLDVGLKWQAVDVSILLDMSCNSPMSGDNTNPSWRPFWKNVYFIQIFLCALKIYCLPSRALILCVRVVKGPPFRHEQLPIVAQ